MSGWLARKGAAVYSQAKSFGCGYALLPPPPCTSAISSFGCSAGWVQCLFIYIYSVRILHPFLRLLRPFTTALPLPGRIINLLATTPSTGIGGIGIRWRLPKGCPLDSIGSRGRVSPATALGLFERPRLPRSLVRLPQMAATIVVVVVVVKAYSDDDDDATVGN